MNCKKINNLKPLNHLTLKSFNLLTLSLINTSFYMIPLLLLLIVAFLSWHFFVQKDSSKRVVKQNAAPVNEALLEKEIAFYQTLNAVQKKQFQERVQGFLNETVVTGVDTEVSEKDKLMIGAAAIIPIFNFPSWKYHHLNEVLVYSDAINMEFETSGNNGRNILGMVGTGSLEGKLLISKHALQQGFLNKTDKHNTAIHEFIHLIDKADGETDGIPHVLLEKEYVLPWINMTYEKMHLIASGKTDINPYATMNKTEFFAVVAEYFFERPDLLRKKHPALFQILVEMFDVD